MNEWARTCWAHLGPHGGLFGLRKVVFEPDFTFWRSFLEFLWHPEKVIFHNFVVPKVPIFLFLEQFVFVKTTKSYIRMP